jgi:hypothetical protein
LAWLKTIMEIEGGWNMQSPDTASQETIDHAPEEESIGSKKKPSASIKGLFSTTSRLVQQAANILEEEIASGIIAAKKAEQRILNVKRIHAAEKSDLMQRFRKDAHEVVDVLMDLVTAATHYIEKMAQLDISVGKSRSAAESPAAYGNIPTLCLNEAIPPGQAATVSMYLDNKSTSTTEKFRLYCTDLVNASGKRVAHGCVTFAPENVVVQPKDSSKVDITVSVPADCTSGCYSGLIQAQNLESLRAILMINVS